MTSNNQDGAISNASSKNMSTSINFKNMPIICHKVSLWFEVTIWLRNHKLTAFLFKIRFQSTVEWLFCWWKRDDQTFERLSSRERSSGNSEVMLSLYCGQHKGWWDQLIWEFHRNRSSFQRLHLSMALELRQGTVGLVRLPATLTLRRILTACGRSPPRLLSKGSKKQISIWISEHNCTFSPQQLRLCLTLML